MKANIMAVSPLRNIVRGTQKVWNATKRRRKVIIAKDKEDREDANGS